MPLPEQMVILVVDDLENDIFLIRRAFEQAGVKNPIFVVRDGEEAVSYLEGDGKFSNRAEFPLPDLMLLDLKLPKMDGFEVLEWVRKHPAFKGLRIVALTSSEDIYDVNAAYHLGANSFLVKPLEFENYPAMMRTLASFWLEHSEAPEITRPAKGKPGRKEG